MTTPTVEKVEPTPPSPKQRFRAVARVADGRVHRIPFTKPGSAEAWARASFNGTKGGNHPALDPGVAINVETLSGSPLVEVIVIDIDSGDGSVITAESARELTLADATRMGATTTTRRDRQGPEEQLLLAYVNHLRTAGHDVDLHTRYPNGRENDAYDLTDRVLIEAKASCRHEHVWIAFAQLIEYSDLETRPVQGRLVLLPDAPSSDSRRLLRLNDIAAIWPSGATNAFQSWERC